MKGACRYYVSDERTRTKVFDGDPAAVHEAYVRELHVFAARHEVAIAAFCDAHAVHGGLGDGCDLAVEFGGIGGARDSEFSGRFLKGFPRDVIVRERDGEDIGGVVSAQLEFWFVRVESFWMGKQGV